MPSDFRAVCATHSGHHNKTPRERFGAVEAGATWQNQTYSPEELANWIRRGNAWCACHLEDGKRDERHAGVSNLIVLDIDGDLTLDAFWAIAPVARHCLLTATSCSHTETEHRFRAVFRVEEHDDPALHRAIYHLWLDRLGLKLKDNSGEKPERLWFGNDNAEVRFGAGEPIPWDVVEAARDALAKAHSALPKAPAPAGDDLALDLRRAAIVLSQLLRPSDDGEYESYWMRVLNAAAATADEAVHQAFLQWHHRGHHSKTQQRVEKRLQKAGTKLTPSAGAHKLLSFAKEQHGDEWWRQIPQELWYGNGSGSHRPPTVLMSSRSASDTAPFETIWTPGDVPPPDEPEKWEGEGVQPPLVLGRSRSASDITPIGATPPPDVVPSPRELQKLAEKARVTVLGVSARTDANTPSSGAAPVKPPTLDQQLRQLYFLRAHDQLVIGDDIRQVMEDEFTSLDRELLGALLSHPGYCNQPSEVDSDLLKVFRREHSFRQKTRARVASFKLTGTGRKRAKWLIPNFLIVGGEHVLYAKGGVGKTTLALHMARAITGDPEINQFLDSGVYNNQPLWQRNPVLFIGTDMYGSAEEMTNSYLEDFNLAGRDFLDQVEWWFQDDEKGTPPWMLCLKDLVHLYEFLQAQTDKGMPVAAVFIDSMKSVCPDHLLVGQQGFKDYIKLVKNICKKFNAALIWVHHARGDGSGAQGIQRITEESDANFHLKRDEKTKQLTLEVEKIRGGKAREIPLSLFTKAGPRVTQHLPSSEDDSNLGKATREQAVLEVLAEGFKIYRLQATGSAQSIEKNYTGMKLSEIQSKIQSNPRYRSTGFSRASLQRTIADLKGAGQIVGINTYRLPPHFQLVQTQQPNLIPDEPRTCAKSEDGELPGW